MNCSPIFSLKISILATSFNILKISNSFKRFLCDNFLKIFNQMQ
ncbi:hypothetical protein LEP1GSC088_0920 [Leptospira interrogans str. L1207]|nr:hypothetical protein LEP1GSC088_0920 [Leptospira interrogans str. L1207]